MYVLYLQWGRRHTADATAYLSDARRGLAALLTEFSAWPHAQRRLRRRPTVVPRLTGPGSAYVWRQWTTWLRELHVPYTVRGHCHLTYTDAAWLKMAPLADMKWTPHAARIWTALTDRHARIAASVSDALKRDGVHVIHWYHLWPVLYVLGLVPDNQHIRKALKWHSEWQFL